MDADKSSLSTRIRASQVKLLYDNAAISIFMSLFNAALVFFLLWQFMPKLFLLIWLGAMILVSLTRIGIYRYYWYRHAEREHPRRWEHLYLIGAYASGLLWGLLIYIAATQDILWLQGFIGFITAGMTAGGLIAMAPLLSASIPHSLLVTVPYAYALAGYADRIHLIMAAMAVIYLLFLIRTSMHMHRIQLQSIKAQLESDDLYEFLQHSKNDTEQLNRWLASEASNYGEFRGEREQFFEYAIDPLCVIGNNGYIDLANPALEKLTGLGNANLRSQSLIELVHPEDRDRISAALEAARSGTRAVQFRCSLRCSDDSWVPLIWRAAIREGRFYASARLLRKSDN